MHHAVSIAYVTNFVKYNLPNTCKLQVSIYFQYIKTVFLFILSSF